MSRNQDETARKRRQIIALAVLAALTAGVLLILLLGGDSVLRAIREPEHLRQWIESHGFWGQIIYVLCMIFQIVLAVIPGEPLELMAGYAFGTIPGTLLCLGAATLGSVLVFGLVRRYGMRLVELFFPREKIESLKFLKTSPRRTVLFTLIFAIPGTPKDLLCYFAGLTDMKFAHFLLIASFGRIPSIFTSTLSGDALGTQRYLYAVVILVLVLVLSSLGLLGYHYICRRHSRRTERKKEQ